LLSGGFGNRVLLLFRRRHAPRPEGRRRSFCLVNDLVIALRRLQFENRIRSAWVIDVDAQQGDGTAAITAGDQSIAP